MGVRLRGRPLTLLQPPPEPGGIGVHAVQRLELAAVLGFHPLEVGGEALAQRGGEVTPLPPGHLGHLRPGAQGPDGLVQQLDRLLDEPLVRQRQARRPSLAEPAERVQRQVEIEVGRWRGWAQDPAVG